MASSYEIVLSRHREPAPPRSRSLERAVGRDLAYGVRGSARAQAVGYRAAARVETAELVTERAMIGLDRLNRVKCALQPADPIEAAAYDSLIRDFVLVSRTELRRLTKVW